jgi:hypothetical protein
MVVTRASCNVLAAVVNKRCYKLVVVLQLLYEIRQASSAQSTRDVQRLRYGCEFYFTVDIQHFLQPIQLYTTLHISARSTATLECRMCRGSAGVVDHCRINLYLPVQGSILS